MSRSVPLHPSGVCTLLLASSALQYLSSPAHLRHCHSEKGDQKGYPTSHRPRYDIFPDGHVSVRAPAYIWCRHSPACVFCPTVLEQPSALETLPLGNGCPKELPKQATNHSMTSSLMATSRCVPLHPSGVCTLLPASSALQYLSSPAHLRHCHSEIGVPMSYHQTTDHFP
jgi:hypothetical protein